MSWNRRVVLHESNNAGQSSSVLELGTHKIVHPDVFFISDIENAIEATNPINSIIIIALLFFFFNAFFKITAAPFHM